LNKVTMDEFAKRLDVSKATIYNHFKSREEIIEMAVTYKIGEIKKFKDFFMDTDLDYLERYYKGIRYYTEQLSDVSHILLKDIKNLYPEMWQNVQVFQGKSSEVLYDYYAEGKKKGYFKDINIDMLVISDRWFFETVLHTNFLMEKNLDSEQAFDEYFRMKFKGLLTDSSIEKFPLAYTM
jgi:AcrR family transcriptional regulator